MVVQQKKIVQVGFAMTLIGFVLCMMCAKTCMSASKPVFATVLENRPLMVYSIHDQQAQVNLNFSFSLSSFISSINPEIDFQITNNFIGPFADLKLLKLTSGLTPIYDGENVCSQVFSLNTAQKCLLRFNVDKPSYSHNSQKNSIEDGLIACLPPYGTYCWRLVVNTQLDAAVANAPGPTQLLVTPEAQDGLYFDKETLSIKGKPTRTGTYYFTIGATNGASTATSKQLHIIVEVNLHDKPVFKPYHSPASAMPEHEYRLNLINLIEPISSFMETNQVQFRIDTDQAHPSWLSIDNENPTLLHGYAPASESGKNREVTLIASSNTGGDSLPLTITIPVAFDLEKRPVIEPGIALTGTAGTALYQDIRSHIVDPTADSHLKLILDNVKPAAPWLSVSSENPTVITGTVPQDAVGQRYQLTLYANTAVSGNSEPVTVSLQIRIDESKTPRFYSAKPALPRLYAGQSYCYDFTNFNDVEPRYYDIPYTVEFSEGFSIPEWIRIENNTLIADKIPSNLEKKQQLLITIKNTPGGKSEVLSIDLVIMK